MNTAKRLAIHKILYTNIERLDQCECMFRDVGTVAGTFKETRQIVICYQHQ